MKKAGNLIVMLLMILATGLLSCKSADTMPDVLQEAVAESGLRYGLLMVKETYSLTVYSAEGEEVARYTVAYGSNPDGGPKLHRNDNRTPEGLYHITTVLSMDADKSTSAYKDLARLNDHYFRARDGHHRFGKPDVDLGKNVYGPRFFRINYPAPHDRERYKSLLQEGKIPDGADGKPETIGFGIAIHGNNDPASIGHKASSGCIRMYNRDIIALTPYISKGTPLLIQAR